MPFKKAANDDTRYKNLIQYERASVGRRIVDVEFLADQLNAGCSNCGEELRLKDIVKETVRGLCSIFKIRCKSCCKLSFVRTSSTTTGTGKQPYSVNMKAALGKKKQ